MRASIAILFAVLALWRAVLDWQATIGQGYAYRFGTFDTLLSGLWPEPYGRFVAGLGQSRLPWAWDPVGALVLSMPVAPVLAALAAGLWITRERQRRARW